MVRRGRANLKPAFQCEELYIAHAYSTILLLLMLAHMYTVFEAKVDLTPALSVLYFSVLTFWFVPEGSIVSPLLFHGGLNALKMRRPVSKTAGTHACWRGTRVSDTVVAFLRFPKTLLWWDEPVPVWSR